MFCIDDLSEIMLFGNENTDDCQMMILEVLPCKGKQCLPLSNLYTNWPQFYTITNTQTYDKTQYDQSKVISNSTSINNHIISTATPHLDRGKISVNWLNLYDALININIEVFMTYFQTRFGSSEPLSDENPAILVISFEISLDRLYNERVVYGILNFLSDVGGMQGTLLMIFGFIVSQWNST